MHLVYYAKYVFSCGERENEMINCTLTDMKSPTWCSCERDTYLGYSFNYLSNDYSLKNTRSCSSLYRYLHILTNWGFVLKRLTFSDHYRRAIARENHIF